MKITIFIANSLEAYETKNAMQISKVLKQIKCYRTWENFGGGNIDRCADMNYFTDKYW